MTHYVTSQTHDHIRKEIHHWSSPLLLGNICYQIYQGLDFKVRTLSLQFVSIPQKPWILFFSACFFYLNKELTSETTFKMFQCQCGKSFYSKCWLFRKNKFFSGCWHIMSMMRLFLFIVVFIFFQTATVSLLHNWLTQTDTNKQSDIYSIYNIFYPPLTAGGRRGRELGVWTGTCPLPQSYCR